MGGGGFVNWGNHAHFEATVIASGHQSLLTPYGGLRLSQVVPLSRSARSDSPTAGGFPWRMVRQETPRGGGRGGGFFNPSAPWGGIAGGRPGRPPRVPRGKRLH